MLINCLINLVILAVLAVIALWILDILIGFIELRPPPQLIMLIRLLVALLLLWNFVQCAGLMRRLE